jgi:glycosyltransferase involved in cell wall biosynthesis
LDAVKGPDLLLDALTLLEAREESNEWHCYIVGDGSLRRLLTRRLAQRALNARVTLLGSLPPSALVRWYQAADAVVLSSRSEGLPNVLAEAKACGVPVIATDVGGVRELIDENDRVVRPNDPAALAAAISDLIRSDRARRESGLAVPLPLPSWRDSAAALVRVIARVLASARVSAVRGPMPAMAASRSEQR